ncbi:type VII secretion protein EccB [Planosporangium mesophilum]|uniref:Type VII secretion protein EccB n=1 Tax=Planosporangium mesophilum TaxID=689768 RepID=A0A8J3X3T6_9ACTN|nr:type VII secretion protein EccB [Planosporangium mesophilum]NJC82045.1 type VII secretion protein EccB [Planosporangium mesophilum]GII26346.1 type VII secretion protein EccB [Planosporangium mesophilum]
MPSRQDQLHSYQFSVQRVVAALVMRETDPAQSPFRRVAGATMAGAIVAALALAGAAVYGLLAGGAGNWRTEGQVIIEKESGTRYVFYKGDRKLHPVINYASALLIADGAQPNVVTWSQAALDKAERGAPMGIAGAPDSLPIGKRLVKTAWTLCSQSPSDSADTSDTGKPLSVLLVGGSVGDGQSLVPVGVPGDPTGLLVSTPDGKRYLVYNNRRFQVVQPNQVLAAFGWSATTPMVVSPALINALPAGPDLKPLPIPRRGERSPALPGARIGQVYQLNAGSTQYSVMLADGLAAITPAQANLLMTDPETPDGGKATNLQPAEYDGVQRSKAGLTAEPPFAVKPQLASGNSSVCVSIRDAKGVDRVVVDAKLSDLINASVTPARTTSGAVLADRVVVPPGRGALVESAASPGATNGALSIVTDRGIRYPLSSRDLVAKLGYGDITPVPMPAELVALLPSGPVLDPVAARQSAAS